MTHPPTSRWGRGIRGLFEGVITVSLIGALGIWWFDLPTRAAGSSAEETVPSQLVASLPVLAPDSVENLEVVQRSTADSNNKRAIAYVRVEGMEGLPELVDDYVRDQTKLFEDAQTDTSGSDELNIGWELPAAVGQFLGVRLTSIALVDGGPPRINHGTVYGDRYGTAVTSRQLFTDAGARTGVQVIRDALASADEAAGGTEGQKTNAAPKAEVRATEDVLLSDIVFDSAGAAIAVLKPEASPGADAGSGVRIDPDLTTVLLSDIGSKVRAAHVAQDPFVGLPELAPVEEDTKAFADSDAEPGSDEAKDSDPSKESDEQAESKKKADAEKAAKKKSKPKKKAKPKKVNCAKKKCIALTFDDGPGPDTARLLKTLKKQKVPATFFLIGRNVSVYPDEVKTMSKQGHEVASHTWSHPDLRGLSSKKIKKQLSGTSGAIKKVTGSAPTLMRPPYGAIDKKVAKAINKQGQAAILWDVDTEDWKNLDSKTTSNRALEVRKGSIVLMHDIYPSTVDAVPGIIKNLKKQGYTFVTVSQLLPKTKAGQKYYRQ